MCRLRHTHRRCHRIRLWVGLCPREKECLLTSVFVDGHKGNKSLNRVTAQPAQESSYALTDLSAAPREVRVQRREKWRAGLGEPQTGPLPFAEAEKRISAGELWRRKREN